MVGKNIRWRPFVSFEFFESGDVLLITDGEAIDIYEYHEYSSTFQCRSGPEEVNLNKDCYYIEKYHLIKIFNGA